MVYTRQYTRSKIHPLKFALWISLASILMMFAAFTSAYVVRKAAGNWLDYEIPGVFYLSTIVIILSSITLHGAYLNFNKQKETLYKSLLGATFVLGLLFIILQYQGWMTLFGLGIELSGNPSGSFFYVISGVHAAHVLGGLAVLFVALIHAFGLPFVPSLRRKLRLELSLHYWHFVDLLWIYLLIFLQLQ